MSTTTTKNHEKHIVWLIWRRFHSPFTVQLRYATLCDMLTDPSLIECVLNTF